MKVALHAVRGADDPLPADCWCGVIGFHRTFNPEALVIAVRVRRLVAVCAGAMGTAYMAGCFALTWWFQRQPFNEIAMADLFWPTRWAALPQKRAHTALASGAVALAKRDYYEALAQYRRALRQTPGDHAIRIKLARVYLECGWTWQALAVLEEGLKHPPLSTEGVNLFLGTALQTQDYQLAERAARQLLRLPPADATPGQRRRARQAQLVARLASGHNEQALALAHALNSGAVPEALDAEVQALLALDRPLDAMALLLRFESDRGADAPYLQLRATVTRRLPDMFLFHTTQEILRTRFSGQPEILRFVLGEYHQAGLPAAAAEVLEDYLWRYGADPAHLLAVAQICADLPAPWLVERCRREAAELGEPAGNFHFLLAQARVKTGDWRGAESALAGWRPVSAALSAEEKFYRAWLTSLLAILRHDSASDRIILAAQLERRQPASIYVATLQPLRQCGRTEAAQVIVTLAQRHYPQNSYFRAQAAALAPVQIPRAENSATVPAARAPAATARD